MAPFVVRRWVQAVLLPLGLLAVWALARAVGTLFLVVVIACLVALVLAPPVRLLSRWLPRGLAIPIVYLGLIAIVALVLTLLATPVTDQVTRFEHNLPALTRHANRDLVNLQSFLNRHHIKVHIVKQGQSALTTLEHSLLKRSSSIVSFSRGVLARLVDIGIDVILILVLSIYLLIYGGEIGRLVRRIMPDGDGTPEDDYPRLVQHAVSSYVRGQLAFSLVMGGSATLLVSIFGWLGVFPAGTQYGWAFGAFYGLMEFVPYIGPIIGPIPALLVALFQHPISAVWLLIAFIGLQQAEGHIVAPQLFRLSLRINPIVIIVALLVGDQLYGIAGAVAALPVLAIVRTTIVYLRRHTVLESWGPPLAPSATDHTAAGIALGPPPSTPPPPAEP